MLSSAIKTQPLTPPTLACKVKPQPSEMMPDRPNCPRCDSSNTKFCYYNNYNFSQPRYFCKSCRRYWTLGGSLRNIPAGGTPRKNAPPPPSSSKRRRGPVPVASAASSSPPPPSSGTEPTSDSISGTFAKLLSEPLPSGFLTLGDAGLDDLDAFFDPEKTTTSTWPFLPADDGVVFDVGDGWDFTGIGGGQGGEDLSVVGGGEDGNCFGWADLAAIPTPGKNF